MKKFGVLVLLILAGILILYLFYAFFNSSVSLSGKAILSSVKCIDSDGGNKPNSKGMVFYRWRNYTDYCYERNTKLIEYYCFNGLKDKSYTCPYGCKNGACLIKPK